MIKLLKHFLSPKKQNQLVGIVKYSDKIIIETYHKTDTGVYVRSSEVSVIPSNASAMEIGESVFMHLSLSKSRINYTKYDNKKSAEDYKKSTGLKSIKAQMNDSKYISVDRNDDKLIVTPHINGGTTADQRGYREKKDFKKNLENVSSFELGKVINETWQDCE